MVDNVDMTVGDATASPSAPADGTGLPKADAESTTPDKKIVVSEARKALVRSWIKKIKSAKEKSEKAFKRMRTCQKIATDGTDLQSWLDGDNYVVPVINRHINQAVATLYARNPKALAKRKQKLMYTVWDGDPASLKAATAALNASMQPPTDPGTGAPLPPATDPNTGQPIAPPVDPNVLALLKEVEEVRLQLIQYDRMGKTLSLLFQYYLDEQDAGYREQIKALVRRAKVNGVSYIELGFQRALKPDPDVTAAIPDATSQLAAINALTQQLAAGDIQPDDPKAEELRLLIQDLQQKPDIIAREGPVLRFPRSTKVIIDQRCYHLKTLAGARWLAEELSPMSKDDIQEVYQVDIAGEATQYQTDGTVGSATADSDALFQVWKVQDKQNGQAFVVCDGYPDFLVEPAEPTVRIERFWTIIPLVFNEVENEKELYPPSDVWNARHMQKEYNSSRQGLSEHRMAGRPRYATAAGKLEEKDEQNLGISDAHSIIKINGMSSGDKIDEILQRIPTTPIDPNLYETESTFADIQRSVGSQAANLGGTSDATATESSIAENSRMTASADEVDDLDCFLTVLARAMGQLMLLELDKQTVIEIAGPGAVWPEQPPTREQVNKELILDVVAGSNGRPNKAAELANYERAMPYLQVLPGVNPIPLAKHALELLDIDLEDAIVEGLPSITAVNAMASAAAKAPPPPAGPAPTSQGPQGGNNAPQLSGQQGGQPAFPGPGPGNTPSGA